MAKYLVPTLLGPALALAVCLTAPGAEEPTFSLEVEPDASGVHAHGVVWLPAAPDRVREVLTDYEHWPELFPGRFRVTAIRREPLRVLTDLQIDRFPLPGTMRLLCATQLQADGSVVTSLVEGDFSRYRRQWILMPEERDGRAWTRGEMDLRFELTYWVPSWLMRSTLRSQMEDHFRALHTRVQIPAGPSRPR